MLIWPTNNSTINNISLLRWGSVDMADIHASTRHGRVRIGWGVRVGSYYIWHCERHIRQEENKQNKKYHTPDIAFLPIA